MNGDVFWKKRENAVYAVHKIKCKLSLIENVLFDVMESHTMDEYETNRVSGAWLLAEDIIDRLEKLKDDIYELRAPEGPSEQAA